MFIEFHLGFGNVFTTRMNSRCDKNSEPDSEFGLVLNESATAMKEALTRPSHDIFTTTSYCPVMHNRQNGCSRAVSASGPYRKGPLFVAKHEF